MATNSEPRLVRGSSSGLDSSALVRQPVTELAGVSQLCADGLAKLGINTIFDLGASQLFAGATLIAASQSSDSLVGRFGLVPTDLVTDAARLLPLAELADAPINTLRGISTALADEFAKTMGIATVQDLVSWPPFLAARSLVGIASGGSDDPETTQTEQLQPRLGAFATERVYFSTLALLQMQGNTDRQVELAGAISLNDIPAGFSQPAVGALLTYAQSWIVQGVTLGQLLHSVALAPGEATRIAVIDWSRRTAATASEDIGETERLDNAANHARTVSEVQSAVAEDFQAGGSRSSASSSSDSTGAANASGSGLIESLFESSDTSESTQSANTNSNSASSSWSSGNRSVLASMLQNVNDLTEQHSARARNRRATSVREVSQSEHEEVSTRIVANYNHMHALTVQYFEVVQLYRIVSELHRVDRCMFVPLELLDFSGDAGVKTIERWRVVLERAALNRHVQSLLADDTTAIELMPVVPVRSRFGRVNFAKLVKASAAHRVVRPGVEVLADAAQRPVPPPVPATDAGGSPPAVPPAAPPAPVPTPSATDPAPVLRLWDERLARLAAKLVDRPLFRRGSDSLFVPEDTELVAISFDGVHIKTVILDRGASAAAADQLITVPADASMVDVMPPQRLIELDAIALTKVDAATAAGTMTLHCLYLGRALTLPAVPLLLTTGTAAQRVLTLRTDRADRQRELAKHLQAHRDHYSRAVFRALDSTTLTLLLSRFKWNGKPLIEQVEPTPVSVAGNYVILRAPVDADEDSGIVENKVPLKWGDLLKRRGVEPGKQRDERIVPIQTGGVFAEAVLGRANAAEKLDITRFWNWQDSPIPLAPTEIAPVAVGSRGTAENLTPGQLSTPVLNIMPGASVPDPAGVGAALGALANMNFRDMSGLAGTQALSQAALAGTLDAATAAGTLASENLKTEAQKAVAMGQIAADIAKAAIAASTGGVGALGGGAAKTISEKGALINHGKDMDSRAPLLPAVGDADADTSDAGSDASSGSTPTTDDGEVRELETLTRRPASSGGGVNESEAYRQSVWGTLGSSATDAASVFAAPGVKKGGLSTSGKKPKTAASLLFGLKADEERWKLYAKYQIGGAKFLAADSFKEVIDIVTAYDEIGILNFYYHGAAGQIQIGEKVRDITDFAADFAKAAKLPIVRHIDFDGCNVGRDAKSLDVFGKVFGAKKVAAWNLFHCTHAIAFPASMSKTDIETHAEYHHYDGYFMRLASADAVVRDTPGKPHIVPVEWFQNAYDSTPSLPAAPGLTGFDTRTGTYYKRSEAVEIVGDVAFAEGELAAAGGPTMPLMHIVVEP